MPKIIPKSLVTLRFSKISLHELKGGYKCFQMRYLPHFYVDSTHSNTYFSKVSIWRVLLQGTVCFGISKDFKVKAPQIWGFFYRIRRHPQSLHHNFATFELHESTTRICL